jgi:hypothetical protein
VALVVEQCGETRSPLDKPNNLPNSLIVFRAKHTTIPAPSTSKRGYRRPSLDELCADVFQSAWRDPALVRHGRAGQRQHGVDIVARNGALYPIGLRCKKRAQWPVTKVTKTQVDAEVAAALNFKPALKAFYILTTALDDAKLLKHVRQINERHEAAKLFEVILLGWNEIVRRATLDRNVADKHFGSAGGGAPRSPLLATWMLSKGRLEKTGEELALSVEELIQDLHDWPTGHFILRLRESDDLTEKLRRYEGRNLSNNERKQRKATPCPVGC